MRADTVVSLIRLETDRLVRLDRVLPRILKLVGTHLVEQADAPPLLPEIENGAPPLSSNELHGSLELRTTIAPGGAKHLAGQALGMRPDQTRTTTGDIPHDESEVMLVVNVILVDVSRECSKSCRQFRRGDTSDQPLMLQPVADDIGDRHDLDSVLLTKFGQRRKTRHSAVFVHDLADDRAWGATGDARKVELVRERVKVPTVEWFLLEPGLGYVAVRKFQEATGEDVTRALEALALASKGHLKALILDLRGNPGGLLDQGIKLADTFLSEGEIVAIRGRPGTSPEVRVAHGPGTWKEPRMLVLVDQGSASAAEIVAGALQDHGRAEIMGIESYGKGSVQTFFDLEDGSGLKLTTARYYTPSGRSLEGAGITPDIPVEAFETEDIVAGVEASVAARVAAMAGGRVVPPVVFTGGVAMVPGMDAALDSALGNAVTVAPSPQLTCALGAAILAAKRVR